MADEWYYLKGEQQVGPISREKLLDAYQWGEIDSRTLVWSEAMTDWQPAGQVPGLLPVISTMQAPPPGPTQAPPVSGPAAYTTPYAPPAQYGPTGLMQINAPGAVGALICGILALTCCGAITGIPAILLGASAKRQIRENPGLYTGSGMATAGIVLGIISIAWTAIALLIAVSN